eukprot:6481229-Alexandrium_andersonii.AAC.1
MAGNARSTQPVLQPIQIKEALQEGFTEPRLRLAAKHKEPPACMLGTGQFLMCCPGRLCFVCSVGSFCSCCPRGFIVCSWCVRVFVVCSWCVRGVFV